MSGGAVGQRPYTDDLLCYSDQIHFIMHALGRAPLLQLTWVYPHPLDEVAVKQFNEHLAQGLLGRVLQRSPLPWGRHRWVSWPVPAPVTWFRDPIPAERLPEWRSLLLALPVDPEQGPGWRVAVQSLEGGGSALSFLVSHTIADGMAVVQAIADAVVGRRLDPGFPAPSWRWSPAMLARDSVESARALPGVWRALASLAGRAFSGAAEPRPASGPPRDSRDAPRVKVDVPLVQIVMDGCAFDERASELGVRGNTLLAALTTRIAFRMGRVDADGRVKLVLPVSDRKPGDRRGNAVLSITVMADPGPCQEQPLVLQRQLKAALRSLLTRGDDMSTLLPLVPYVPLWLARHMERLALGDSLPVFCSILGELPPELNSPLGEASLLQASPLGRNRAAELEQRRGNLFVACYRTGGRVLATVQGYAPDRFATGAAFATVVRAALADLGLLGSVS